MWLNSKEEFLMGPFVEFIKTNENKSFKFVYDNGSEFIFKLYLYEYESDNGFDINDNGFEEYWEMAFEIIEILKDDSNKHSKGDKILVNYRTLPKAYTIYY